jgi:serralysin
LPDIPGDNTTTATISVGGTVSSTLETLGDHDWFRITLTAGQSITVFVDGTTLEDSYLRIRNAAGTVIFENDDISSGVDRDSRLSFSAPSTGTYYIDVGAFDEAYTGDYQVSVSVYTPPPLATYDQIANQLVEGYWGGDDHHFNVTQGGSITVNITALTPAGQNLARSALQLWGDVIGVTFTEVSSGGQITFDDNQSGAFTDGSWSGGIISSEHVNISTQWLANYGTGLNSYSFQTYVHEIGHALGLGHAGNYNGSATYPYDALFQNDAWVTSIMSYFSPTDNTYFGGQGFTENFVVTPEMADIIAMSTLYGLSTTTRTGDTTYGFNSNAGRAVYDANLVGGVAFTIFDSGGIDTLDYSGFGTDQLINLNPETFSNVGLGVGNLSIARGVTIENAIGGNGNDTLIGNDADNLLDGHSGNDSLSGGLGNDTLLGGAGAGTDTLDGGAGADTASYASSLAGVNVSLLLAGAGQNTGGAGIDRLVSIENLTGSPFADALTGDPSANTLIGLAGDDILNGGTGADTMIGGLGNDRYVVDQAGDVITEFAGEGDDMVIAKANYTLGAGVSIETMTTINASATTPINLTGNEYGQSIYGNAGNNILTGNGGSDYLVGLAGNDWYFVDASDFISEANGGGDDWIFVPGTYTLREGIEIETLVAVNQDSTDPVNLTGNEYGQSLYGSQGANSLNGGAGNDYLVGLGGNDFLLGGAGNDNMAGGQGNDIYYVDSGDWVIEAAGEGDDLAVAFSSFALRAGESVETLSAAEGGAAINLTGNALAQSLYGNDGANILTGGGGADYLIGGAGADIFVLSNAAVTSPGPANISTIADYASGDVVDVTQILSVAAGTDVIGGGYLKVTAGGQIQVDLNGGGDQWVTLSNVNGSGAVTVRYLAGGSATDFSVARSASQSAAQSAAMIGAVAAAGMAAIVPTAPAGDDAALGDHLTASVTVTPATAAGTLDLVPVPDISRLSLAHETRVALDDSASLTSILGKEAPSAPDAHPVALHGMALPAALEQGTDVPAQAAIVSPLAAPSIVMPSAEQLLAVAGSADGVQHNALVSQVLLDALAGATGGGPIDALLDTLPGAAATGMDHSAQLAAGFAAGPGPAFGADSAFHSAFALDTLALHHDAPPAAA